MRIKRKCNISLQIENSKKEKNDIYETHETFRKTQEHKYLFGEKESRTLSTR